MGKKKVSGQWKEDATKKAKNFLGKAKKSAAKVVKSGGKSYGSFVAPTVGLFKKAGTVATTLGKTALKFPGTGLAASAAYYGGKAVVNKIAGRSKGLKFADYSQFNKKGRKF